MQSCVFIGSGGFVLCAGGESSVKRGNFLFGNCSSLDTFQEWYFSVIRW